MWVAALVRAPPPTILPTPAPALAEPNTILLLLRWRRDVVGNAFSFPPDCCAPELLGAPTGAADAEAELGVGAAVKLKGPSVTEAS